MLSAIYSKFPEKFNKYIEPFVGGGAVFFGSNFKSSVISDMNEELIITYNSIANEVEIIIEDLKLHENTSDYFYEIRALDWKSLPSYKIASRMIYLNRTCFNGLYRVNKSGQFNSPYGKYPNPNIVDEKRLNLASRRLRSADIYHSDYERVLKDHARPGDLVFLDPPYFPVGKYSDFNRYNSVKFNDEHQIKLAENFVNLVNSGVSVVLTNSNHPMVHELYGQFDIDVVDTRRNISSNSSTRKGQDLIISSVAK